jgi:hypothetical protein
MAGAAPSAGMPQAPPAHDEQPPAHDEHPPAHDEQPPAHDEQPPAHDEQPPAHDEQPPAGYASHAAEQVAQGAQPPHVPQLLHAPEKPQVVQAEPSIMRSLVYGINNVRCTTAATGWPQVAQPP